MRLLRCGGMDVPLSVKGFATMRVGAGLAAIAVPSVLARALGLPVAQARTPLALSATAFFGIRELGLAAVTVGATPDEPKALRRLLFVNAATDGLDVVILGLKGIRNPRLRRSVVLFAPAAVFSVLLHLRAAKKVEVVR